MLFPARYVGRLNGFVPGLAFEAEDISDICAIDRDAPRYNKRFSAILPRVVSSEQDPVQKLRMTRHGLQFAGCADSIAAVHC